ncbi:hypothetical protein TNCV_4873771 [Trichonephila clavipes]|nr:hypothetical protein TNCV_4873771 [Trichonephila clavipes]
MVSDNKQQWSSYDSMEKQENVSKERRPLLMDKKAQANLIFISCKLFTSWEHASITFHGMVAFVSKTEATQVVIFHNETVIRIPHYTVNSRRVPSENPITEDRTFQCTITLDSRIYGVARVTLKEQEQNISEVKVLPDQSESESRRI